MTFVARSVAVLILPMVALAADPPVTPPPASSVENRAADAAPWTPDRGDGTYQNPVLFADYSDPDVVRVGDDFWLVSSSFNHVPGLPILHSRDLVNWTLANHALPALDYPDGHGNSLAAHFAAVQPGGGVWAPSIRFHDGRFYIFFPDPDYGIYVTMATDPRNRWSAPVLVKPGRGLIDPCPLWDDDGKVYLVHAWARSRAGKNNQLTVNELSRDATRVLDGEGTVVIDENTSGRRWNTLEGPKFYRHAGEYWIFAPVGGVTGGTQAVYRAKNVRGPYAARIVLAQGSTAINGPHQGGWVDTPAGENWFVHFQDRGPFGRVVHLEPMSWGADGWPRMGTAVESGAVTGEPVLVHAKPMVGPALRAGLDPAANRDSNLGRLGKPAPPATASITVPATSDDFASPTLGLQWQWQANPRPEWLSLSAQRGTLRLACVPAPGPGDLYAAPNLLLQKFAGPSFTATVELDGSALGENADAGLIVYGYGYAWIGLHRDADGLRLRQVVDIEHVPRPRGTLVDGSFHSEIRSKGIMAARIFLRVSADAAAKCTFASSPDGVHFTPIAMGPGAEFQATVARWVGAKVGLFASAAPGTARAGHADFAAFRVTH